MKAKTKVSELTIKELRAIINEEINKPRPIKFTVNLSRCNVMQSPLPKAIQRKLEKLCSPKKG